MKKLIRSKKMSWITEYWLRKVLILKLMLFLICLNILVVVGNTYSQTTKLTLSGNVKPEDVLLDETGLKYEIVDKTVILSPKEKETEEIKQEVQKKTITGKVADEEGLPLPGVSVVAKGTTVGIITDIDGFYSLEIPEESNVLVFSFIGMKNQEIEVLNQSAIDVIMEMETIGLDEIVAVGYGVQRKADVTGSVGIASAEDILKTPSFNALEGMRGKISGVNIFTNSGSPSGSPRVMIRGIGTINSSSDPLYVVDGVVMENFQDLNPNDIEKIEVLKDASSAAIYGSRGANGVILVTTKRGGKDGGVTFSYDSYFTIGHLRKKMDVLNAGEWLEVIERGYENAPKYKDYPDGAPVFTKNDSRLFDASGNPLYDTNWQEEATRTSFSHSHQFSVQQGDEKSSVGAFLNYSDNQGIMLNSWQKRINAKIVYDAKPKEWMSVGINLLINSTWENEILESGGGLGPRRAIIELTPILPVQFPDGSWSNSKDAPTEYGLESIPNPVHVLKTEERLNARTQIFGNFYLSFQLMEGLELKTQIGVDRQFMKNRYYGPKDLITIGYPLGEASINNTDLLYWQQETYLSFNKAIGDHRINSVFGLSWQERVFNASESSAEGFPDNHSRYNNIGAATIPGGLYSNYSRWGINSYFLRGGYTYKDKYLTTVTARVDGSSRFGEGNKYGFFPSMGLGWIISNEDFIDNSGKINHLKLRASYGITGNTEIGTYSSLPTIATETVLLNGERAGASWASRLANPDLTWEKTSQFDVGLDLKMFNQRINLELDYYYKLTTDLLLQTPIPQPSGYASFLDNVGSVSNQGIDFLISSINIDKPDLQWETSLNLNYNKNQIESLGETDADIYPGPEWVSGSQIILRVGESLSSFWGYRRLGTWGTSEEEAAKKAGAVPGEAKRSAEKTIIGKGIPDITGSFINRFTYKNWDLTADIQFVTGVDILQQFFHAAEDRTGYTNGLSSILHDGWTEDNQNTNVQQIRNAPLSGQNSKIDDHWVSDGSYIRGNLFSLGYTFPQTFLTKYGFKSLRVYGSLSNAFVIHSKDFKGFDPEGSSWSSNQWGQNMFFYQYPKPTSFSMGVSLKF